jgi:hypothetical protein
MCHIQSLKLDRNEEISCAETEETARVITSGAKVATAAAAAARPI